MTGSIEKGTNDLETHYKLGNDVVLQPRTVVGLKYKPDCGPAIIGDHSVVRTGSIIYGDVEAGDHFQTGHHAVVREKTIMGRFVLIGSGAIVDGNVQIADFVKIETNCYVCTHVNIGTRVFIGPGVVFANDKYPLKMRDSYQPLGPKVEDYVTVGAGSVVMPGVTIGRGSFVAAGTVVTKNVPADTMAKGNPCRFEPLPDKLKEKNIALNWRGVIHE